MQLTSSEIMFLNMIKPGCVKTSIEKKVCPSVMAALAISISEWGTRKEYLRTRNIYLLGTEGWYGRCYDANIGTYYNYTSDNENPFANLYRVYKDAQESVPSFISFLVDPSLTNNGHSRYASIVGCTDYVECLKRLRRAEFDIYYLKESKDTSYWAELQNIIEKYELYKWDDELKKSISEEESKMSKRRHIHIDKRPTNQDTISTGSIENFVPTALNKNESTDSCWALNPVEEHMYRVRLDWDRPDTQIFASTNYKDAKDEMMKHEGYKIYIDDDGELFEDYWSNFYSKKEPEEDKDPDVKNVIHPIPGKAVVLKNTPVFRKAIDKIPYFYITGEGFYFYDNSVVHGRAKITRVKSDKNLNNPLLIVGYIDI